MSLVSRIRNLVIHSDDSKDLRRLADDYRFMGFDVEQSEGKLIVFCINRRLRSRKERMREQKAKMKSRVKRSWSQ